MVRERNPNDVAADFSELLDADRLRPLWQSGQRPGAAAGEPGAPSRSGAEVSAGEKAKAPPPTGEVGALDDAPPEPAPPESPTRILDKVELLLHIALGPQAILLQIYLQPLRMALARLEGKPYLPHPLQSALQSGNLPLLIYSIEDSYRGLLRAKQRLVK